MFACLYAPDFSAQAALWAEPETLREELRGRPVAILDGPANLPRVMALNAPARRAGLEIGITKIQAQMYPGVWLRKRCEADEMQAQSALLECGENFSPRVESSAPGTVILDLTGTGRLFGSAKTIARKIVDRTQAMGFEIQVGGASNADAALYAARGFRGITVIAAGEEGRRLGPLPVNLLPAAEEILDVLRSWGIHTFHQLAQLAPLALSERLGQEGLHLRQLARGEVQRTLLPVEPAADFTESYEFEDPIETLESLAFVLNRLLQQICARLVARALSTNELHLTLELQVRQQQTGKEQERFEHSWKLPFPVQDGKLLLRLISLELESQTLTAPLKKVVIRVLPVRPQVAQGSLFHPPSPEAQQLEITLARIRGIIGSKDEQGVDCIGSPKVADSHRADSFTLQPFSSERKEVAVREAAPLVAFRKFRPARAARVELNDTRPHFVALGKKLLRVLCASGPWRSSGQWWDAARQWARSEWDVALRTPEGPGYYRIYFDELAGQWFVDGVFD